jgi:hypothetical protein
MRWAIVSEIQSQVLLHAAQLHTWLCKVFPGIHVIIPRHLHSVFQSFRHMIDLVISLISYLYFVRPIVPGLLTDEIFGNSIDLICLHISNHIISQSRVYIFSIGRAVLVSTVWTQSSFGSGNGDEEGSSQSLKPGASALRFHSSSFGLSSVHSIRYCSKSHPQQQWNQNHLPNHRLIL